jgi:tRNA(Ile2) C34 agmatinyltransferase TiaS
VDDDPAGVRDLRDDRPPICPACGVTMGMVLDGPRAGYVCLECGFEEEGAGRSRRREHDA